MWSVIQHRYIKGSERGSGENVVWTGGRHKEALGQAKQNVHSHFEMMDKHGHFPDSWFFVDMEEFSIRFYDGEEVIYEVRYEVREHE